MDVALESLRSPVTLFFLLGLVAGYLKSDLTIPEVVGKSLSLYLMLAIGFRGGVELSHNGLSGAIAVAMISSIALSFTLPLIAYVLLRGLARLDGINAAAVAAHYGSVSVVTFAAASTYLTRQKIEAEPYMVVMLALMETPAIISGLLLARRAAAAKGGRVAFPKNVLREVLLSGAIVLLLGSFVIGWTTGSRGMEVLGPVVETPFKALLAIFLLDLGLLVAARVSTSKSLNWRLVMFGIYMPLIGAGLGLLVGRFLGLSTGGTALLAVLSASASYIVVPAAMRVALPQANPALYVTLTLGITFPFNLICGIPLYSWLAQSISSGR